MQFAAVDQLCRLLERQWTEAETGRRTRALAANLTRLAGFTDPLSEVDRRLQQLLAALAEQPLTADIARGELARLRFGAPAFLNLDVYDREGRALAGVATGTRPMRSLQQRLYAALIEAERTGRRDAWSRQRALFSSFLGPRDGDRLFEARGKLTPVRVFGQKGWVFWAPLTWQPPPGPNTRGALPPEVFQGGVLAWFTASMIPADLGLRAQLAASTRHGAADDERYLLLTPRHARSRQLPPAVRQWLRGSPHQRTGLQAETVFVAGPQLWFLRPLTAGGVLAGVAERGAAPVAPAIPFVARWLALLAILYTTHSYLYRQYSVHIVAARPAWSVVILALLGVSLLAGLLVPAAHREAINWQRDRVQLALDAVDQEMALLEPRFARFLGRFAASPLLLSDRWAELRRAWQRGAAAGPIQRVLLFDPQGRIVLDLAPTASRAPGDSGEPDPGEKMPPMLQKMVGGMVRQAWTTIVGSGKLTPFSLDAMVDGVAEMMVGPAQRLMIMDALTAVDRLQTLALGNSVRIQLFTSVLRDRHGTPRHFLLVVGDTRALVRRLLRRAIDARTSAGRGIQLGYLSANPDEMPYPIALTRYPFLTALRADLVADRPHRRDDDARTFGDDRWLVGTLALQHWPGHELIAMGTLDAADAERNRAGASMLMVALAVALTLCPPPRHRGGCP